MHIKFIKFSMVGTVGFLVDAIVLTALLSTGYFDLYSGRAVSFVCAVTTTWFLNRNFTFKHVKSKERLKEWWRFINMNAIGGLVNYSTYAALVTWSVLMSEIPVLATAVGSVFGLLFNFTSSNYVVYKEPSIGEGSAEQNEKE